MSGTYYNEIDEYAAQWLRNLIKAGHIAPGDVDERSIEDVRPDDLRGYTQCHFFAGLGGWSLALRLAGWPDDRPIWTGSCPCQPFSAAGKGAAFDDERHLWPAFYHLIRERKPTAIAGEQVASKDADPWIDLVHTDLEALGYAFGAVPFPSAGVGAPHLRDRLYWVADSDDARLEGRRAMRQRAFERVIGESGVADGLADAIESERGRRANNGALLGDRAATGRNKIASYPEWDSELGRMANADGHGRIAGSVAAPAAGYGCAVGSASGNDQLGSTGPTNGFWRDADWLGCRDDKWRPVEPGAFPLAHGAAGRVGRLRAYGNAVNTQAAKAFIECYLESRP